MVVDGIGGDSMEKAFNALKKRIKGFNEKFQIVLTQRFHRIITVENKTLRLNKNKQFLPMLIKGQLVNVEFISQGKVLDENHPAIVWAADKKCEHIIVIPLTSKDGEGRYEKRNLGKIKGYNELESIVKINQPHSVSRKSVAPIKQEVDGKLENVIISDNQLNLLDDFFREYHLKELSLRKVIEEKIGLMLPFNLSEEDIVQCNRPIIYDIQGNSLWYRFSNQQTMNKIELVKLKIRNAERKAMIESLFSKDFSNRKLYYTRLQEIANKDVV